MTAVSVLARTLPGIAQACQEGRGLELLREFERDIAEGFAATCLLQMTLKAQDANADTAEETFAWLEAYPGWCAEQLAEILRSTYVRFGFAADAHEVERAADEVAGAFFVRLDRLMWTSSPEGVA